jgi:hypothetical protein
MIRNPNEKFTGISDFSDWDNLSLEQKAALSVLFRSSKIYVGHLSWVKECVECWKGILVPDLVGVFLYRIAPTRPTIPEYHWIVVGPVWPEFDQNNNTVDTNTINGTYSGLPNAYIWTGYPDFDDDKSAPNPALALASYCSVLEDWIRAVRAGGNPSKVFPVATPEAKTRVQYADETELLLVRIKNEILPNYSEYLKPRDR